VALSSKSCRRKRFSIHFSDFMLGILSRFPPAPPYHVPVSSQTTRLCVRNPGRASICWQICSSLHALRLGFFRKAAFFSRQQAYPPRYSMVEDAFSDSASSLPSCSVPSTRSFRSDIPALAPPVAHKFELDQLPCKYPERVLQRLLVLSVLQPLRPTVLKILAEVEGDLGATAPIVLRG